MTVNTTATERTRTVRVIRRGARKVLTWLRAPGERRAIKRFHHLFYDLDRRGRSTWRSSRWFGAKVLKSPLDLWIYQEILVETRPDLVVETGTADGGSALFLAMMCDLLGNGDVVSVDIRHADARPSHERIRYVRGSSVDPDIVDLIRELARGKQRVMVILDSDHSREHVLEELDSYAPLVTQGCYLVVEDTNVNGHPVYPSFGPGPMEAVEEFLQTHAEFTRDRQREKFLVTFNPGGYLRRR
jgi:cephalosporin hydroxylase